MDIKKKRRLEDAGWKVGSTRDFLGLSDQEAAYVEIKVGLARSIRNHRSMAGISQTQLARRLGSSQSRVAKIEAGNPSVSVDLMFRTLLALGADRREIARAIERPLRAA